MNDERKYANGDEDPVAGVSRMAGEMPPPDGMEDALVGALAARGLLARSRMVMVRRVAFGAAVAAAFAIGVWFGASPDTPQQSPPASRYALLLFEGPAFEHGDGHREEYIEWAREFVSSGRFVDGEELGPESRVVGVRDSNIAGDDRLSGFFIVEASGIEEALSVAERHPHIRHNGTIEVRRIRNR